MYCVQRFNFSMTLKAKLLLALTLPIMLEMLSHVKKSVPQVPTSFSDGRVPVRSCS